MARRSNQEVTTASSRRLALVAVGALLLGGCSKLPTSDERSTDQGAPPALAIVDSNGVVRPLDEIVNQPLGIEVTLEQVVGAIGALDAPQPTTIELHVTGSIDGIPYQTRETVMSTPDRSVVSVSVDHYEFGTILLEQLSKPSEDGTASAPTEEVLAMAAAATVPASYLIDGDTRWLQYTTREALDAGWSPDKAFADGPHTELWLAESISDPNLRAPSGIGLDVSPALAEAFLAAAGFDGVTPPPGLAITEQTTTSDRVIVTLGINGVPAVIVELDADLVLTAVETLVSDSAVAAGEVRQRLEISWQADEDLLVVPAADQQFEQS